MKTSLLAIPRREGFRENAQAPSHEPHKRDLRSRWRKWRGTAKPRPRFTGLSRRWRQRNWVALPRCLAILAATLFSIGALSASTAREPSFFQLATKNSLLAPSAVAVTPDSKAVFVACEASGEVLVLDTTSRQLTGRIAVGPSPSGLVLSADGSRLYVTLGGPEGAVCVVDPAAQKVIAKFKAGYQAQSPVLSLDGKVLYVCNRFDNAVGVYDLATGKELWRIAVSREPVSAALTRDGKRLLVANHIHAGPSDGDVVASSVSVIETATGTVLKEIQLPNGSTLLRDIRISPDGRYAVVAHLLARFHLPTTQIERGWINTNAGSIIDLAELKLLNTVLFDNIDSGAATPWAVAWTADGKHLLVTHAGTHEVSVIAFPALLDKLAKIPVTLEAGQPIDYTAASRTAADVPNDLSFLVGVRQRVKLPGRGPRSLAIASDRVFVAHYFSDTLDAFRISPEPPRVESISLGPKPQVTTARLGEFYFNDATICFQGWQSCSSCHSHDARVDGLNWDNLNDGLGNPKNGKSLLLAHQTPPSMWLGVRSNAYVAVRAGIRNSLFTVQPPEVANALDDYLKSLRPMPSPHLVQGQLSPAAQRGKDLFSSELVGCTDCHKGPHYTDMKFHEVGTGSKFDRSATRFDTPALIELWRSGPYLHDGSAATLKEVLTTRNAAGLHGETKHLTSQEIDDLVAFLLSL